MDNAVYEAAMVQQVDRGLHPSNGIGVEVRFDPRLRSSSSGAAQSKFPFVSAT
jgi:hypothetical protein